MDDDHRPIIRQSEAEVGGIETVFAVLFGVFVIVAAGLIIDAAIFDIWQTLQPWYDSAVEFRNTLVGWLRSSL